MQAGSSDLSTLVAYRIVDIIYIIGLCNVRASEPDKRRSVGSATRPC